MESYFTPQLFLKFQPAPDVHFRMDKFHHISLLQSGEASEENRVLLAVKNDTSGWNWNCRNSWGG